MNVQFRKAAVSDVPKLLEWMKENYASDRLEFDPDVARKAWLEIFQHEELAQAWILEDFGVDAGYMVLSYGFSLQYKGRDAYLDEIYIRPDYRGKGLARGAMKYLEDYCRTQGIQAIHLEVTRANVIAQNLYRTAGFQDHDHYLLTKWI